RNRPRVWTPLGVSTVTRHDSIRDHRSADGNREYLSRCKPQQRLVRRQELGVEQIRLTTPHRFRHWNLKAGRKADGTSPKRAIKDRRSQLSQRSNFRKNHLHGYMPWERG